MGRERERATRQVPTKQGRQCELLKRIEKTNSEKRKKKRRKSFSACPPSSVPQSAQHSDRDDPSRRTRKTAPAATTAMGDDKSPRSLSPLGGRDRDRELLIPVSGGGSAPGDGDGDGDRAASSSASAALSSSGREAFHKVVRSWASKKFMTGCVILFPIAITFYITWWFIHFVDGFFSPIYAQLGINIFGLGFITSVTFIFLVGVFMSSWVGASVLSLGEWIIKRMPLVRHIYNASKQISAAISPDQNKQAFKEVVIIRHPRVGEYAFGFITSSVSLQTYSGQEDLYCVYVPTNHLYIGDIFMVNSKDVIRPNLSVREGIEIVVSGGMSMPQILSTLDPHMILGDRTGPSRS